LFLGAYEFIATKQYCKNGLPPKEPAFIFMVDVSYNAIQSGMLRVVCANLERILQRLPKEQGASESVIHVGLATFDQVVHFFDLSAAQPSMMVVGMYLSPSLACPELNYVGFLYGLGDVND
uniref:Sec23_trunk domain-containing protein n=1 Tax=Heligmosomoides polygyrus TaxID=6339 RepID=A0A183FCG0_HELPZ